MYFNVNFNVFFKFIKEHLLASELYIHQNARCNDKNLSNTLVPIGQTTRCHSTEKNYINLR